MSDWSKFLIVAIGVPIAYIVLNVFIRKAIDDEWKVEHWFLGVDLATAAFISVGLWSMEPPTRFKEHQIPIAIRNLGASYELGVSLAIDLVLLFMVVCLQRDWEKEYGEGNGPKSIKEKFIAYFKHLLCNNIIGLVGFVAGAVLMRG